MTRQRLGDLLLQAGLINPVQLRAALGRQRQWGKRLGRTLVEMNVLAEKDLVLILSRQLRMPPVDLSEIALDPVALKTLDEAFCRQHDCLPFMYHERGKFLDVAMADPTDLALFEQIRLRTRCNPRPHIAGPLAMEATFLRVFGGQPAPPADPHAWERMLPTERMLDPEAESAGASFPDIDVTLDTSPAVLDQLIPAGAPGAEERGVGAEPLPSGASALAARLGRLRERLDREALDPGATATAGQREDRAHEPLYQQIESLRQAMIRRDAMIAELLELLFVQQAGGHPDDAREERDARRILPAAGPPPGSNFEFAFRKVSRTPRIAMDFGTTRSSAAVIEDGKIVVVTLPDGGWELPSAVGFREDGTVVVGHAARAMLGTDPLNAILSPKRLLGRKYRDRDLEPHLATMSMGSKEAADGGLRLVVRGKEKTVEEVCSHLLRLLRLVAERNAETEVEEVVLTCPVAFGDRPREALVAAAELAGLRVAELVDEPVAAALANHADEHFSGLVGVYDFGGGTFDFAVVEVGGDRMQVVGSAGDSWLGGDDFDLALAEEAANAFWRDEQIELRHNVVQWHRLLLAAEQAKRELSLKQSTLLSLAEVALSREGPIDLAFPVLRTQLVRITKDIVERSIDTCRDVLELAGVKPSALSAIYLSSGTCYIPAVQEGVARFFGKRPRAAVPPERAVLLGAALHAAMKEA